MCLKKCICTELHISIFSCPQISHPYNMIGRTIESNSFNLHSVDKLLSLAFDNTKCLALVACCCWQS